jgi:hypothetical protein
MKRAPVRTLAIFISLALIPCILGSCDIFQPPRQNPPNPPPPPISPAGVIRGIEWAYNRQDINYYTDMLDTDFTFYFDPRDVQSHGTPSSWGYDDELTATEALFDAVDDGDISLSMNLEGQPEPGLNDEVWDLNGVDYLLIVVTGDMTYRAEGYANFRTRSHDLWEGQARWWLWKWWDIGN